MTIQYAHMMIKKWYFYFVLSLVNNHGFAMASAIFIYFYSICAVILKHLPQQIQIQSHMLFYWYFDRDINRLILCVMFIHFIDKNKSNICFVLLSENTAAETSTVVWRRENFSVLVRLTMEMCIDQK